MGADNKHLILYLSIIINPMIGINIAIENPINVCDTEDSKPKYFCNITLVPLPANMCIKYIPIDEVPILINH